MIVEHRYIETIVALKLAIREAKLNPDMEYYWSVTLEDEDIKSIIIDCPNVVISFDVALVNKSNSVGFVSFNVNRVSLKICDSNMIIDICGNTYASVVAVTEGLQIDCYDNSILDFNDRHFHAYFLIKAHNNAQIVNYYGDPISGQFKLVDNAGFIKGIGGDISAYDNSFVYAYNSQVMLQRDFVGKAWCSECKITTDLDNYNSDKAFVYAMKNSSIINNSGIRIETDGTCGINNFYSEAETETPELSCAKYKPDGKKKFYKAVINDNGKLTSIWDSDYTYEIGKVCQPDSLDTSRMHSCGHGIHVAPLDWCIAQYCSEGFVYLEMEVPDDADVVVPYGTTGKIRVSKAIPVRQLTKEELENNEVYQVEKEIRNRMARIASNLNK
jgi:hypothetical protein